jgi:hypothetical protein
MQTTSIELFQKAKEKDNKKPIAIKQGFIA